MKCDECAKNYCEDCGKHIGSHTPQMPPVEIPQGGQINQITSQAPISNVEMPINQTTPIVPLRSNIDPSSEEGVQADKPRRPVNTRPPQGLNEILIGLKEKGFTGWGHELLGGKIDDF